MRNKKFRIMLLANMAFLIIAGFFVSLMDIEESKEKHTVFLNQPPVVIYW